jgi:hypothetical protein
MRTFIALGLVSLVVGGGYWALRDHIAVIAAPKKVASASRSEAALRADELFWSTFHGGRYDNIQSALDALTAAYLQTPGDAKTAAHIAWLHSWRVTERARLGSLRSTITDETILARRYFEEASRLDPSDARYLGFLAGHTLGEGALHKDERLTRRGYFMLLDAIEAWPEFNLFTGGYVLSHLPADSKEFREGLEWQWRTLDVCIDGKIDRENPDYRPHMAKETQHGRKRVCWNSWIAPHNFEGFSLNMGDMLVKAGSWQTARKIYANARLSKTYMQWKYRQVLEDRIERAPANVSAFNAIDEAATRIFIDSRFACVACHEE